ncbi:hypothetical protein [Lapillicoccus jejuensis]|uniref:Peptidase M50B-like protein n=1 Tax=Lapillicoccus jejuensis TaxID=402171 RepID=A0A542E326_9MICO|nr:hypothetical protein [Lapillicoccus jejuensis]TQJ09732.1 hypothetical protein FB458_2846 [Lapillicoccus jejuensis]
MVQGDITRDIDVHARLAPPGDARRMLLASTAALVLGQVVVIALHETSHAVAGLLLGLTPTQFTSQVRFSPEPTPGQHAVTALTGPAFSLLSGLLVVALARLRPPGWWRLWLAWAGFLSAQEGIGYLVIAPLVSSGDTGAGLAALSAPGWVAWAIGAVGVVLMVLLVRRFAAVAVTWARDLYELRAMIVWPWLVGTAVAVLLELAFLARTAGTQDGDVVAILLGSASLAVFSPLAMVFWQRARARQDPTTLPTQPAPPVPVVAWVLFLVLVLVKLLVVTRGVTW